MLKQVCNFQNNDPVICDITHTTCHIAKMSVLNKNQAVFTYISLEFSREHFSPGIIQNNTKFLHLFLPWTFSQI